MKVGLIVELEDVARGYTPVAGGVEYTDTSGARVFIPMKLLVRLYEGAKWHHEKTSDQPWERYCGHLFIEEGN